MHKSDAPSGLIQPIRRAPRRRSVIGFMALSSIVLTAQSRRCSVPSGSPCSARP
ncbi:hypothetical protein [Lysobacter gummosus]|uniref:hypothetical protein n=1 Tax=Lysobacter gummosus TaxID=262324 RepID=UPI00363A38C1